MMSDSQAPWYDRAIGGVAATAMAPMMLLEEAGRGLLNAPGLLYSSGVNAGRVYSEPTTEGKVIAGLTAVRDGSFGLVGLAPLVPARMMMPTPVLTAQEMAVQKFAGAEANAAAMATYAGDASSPRFVGPIKPNVKFREVEVQPPEFSNLDDWYAYKEARSDGAQYLSDFTSNLKGNARLTVQPQFRQGANYGGALSYPAVPVGAEQTFVGEMALVRDSELFTTMYHEEMHVRLGRQAAAGNSKALDLITGPLNVEENYVESVAARYARMYQNKYGPFQH